MRHENQSLTKKLLDLDQQLGSELRAFSDNVSSLTDTPERKQYDRYCGHLRYIQELLNDAEALTHDIQLDRTDPAFFELLKAKDSIREHSITFGRLRGNFYKNYRVEDEHDQDLERVLEPEEVHPEIADVVIPAEEEDLSQDELFLAEQEDLQDAAALAEAKAADKLKKKKAKRKKEQRRMEELRRHKQLEEQAEEDAERVKQAQREHQAQIEQQEAEYRVQQDQSIQETYLHRDQEQTQQTVTSNPSPLSVSNAEPAREDRPSEGAPFEEHHYRDRSLQDHTERHHQPASTPPFSSAHMPSSAQAYTDIHTVPTPEPPYHSDDAIQQARWEEAVRLGVHQDPQKAISEAELARERMRQEEDAFYAQQSYRERREQEEAVQERFRQRQEAAEQYERLEKGHVDFSRDLYGDKEVQREVPQDTPQGIPVASAQESCKEVKATERNHSGVQFISPDPHEESSRGAEPFPDPYVKRPEDTIGREERSEQYRFHQNRDMPLQEQHTYAPPLSPRPEHQEPPSVLHQAPLKEANAVGKDNAGREFVTSPQRDEYAHGEQSFTDPYDRRPDEDHGREDRFAVHPTRRSWDTPPHQEQHTSVPPLSPKAEHRETLRSSSQESLREANATDGDTVTSQPVPSETPSETIRHSDPVGREDHFDDGHPHHGRDTLPRPETHTVVPPLSPRDADTPRNHEYLHSEVSRSRQGETQSVPHMETPAQPANESGFSGSAQEAKVSTLEDYSQERDQARLRQEQQYHQQQSKPGAPGSTDTRTRQTEQADKKPSEPKPVPHTYDTHRPAPTVTSVGNDTQDTPKADLRTGRTEPPRPSSEQESPIYRSTPFGVREESRPNPLSHLSRDNAQIYSKIQSGMKKSDAGAPVTVSSTYLTSMAWNVHMARIDFQGKKDTTEALNAARQYQKQRQALESLKADIHAGRVKVEQPKEYGPEQAPEKGDNKPKSPFQAQYQYTPFGTQGYNLGANGEVTGSFRINTKAVRDNFRYTAEKPLEVSAKYEAAMQQRLQKATTALDSALQLDTTLPPKIGLDMHNELRLAQDAYAAFKQAKQSGVVVVTGDSKLDKPNFQAWQQRSQANIFGSTAAPKATNTNKVKKEDVEEQGASVFTNKSKLRQEYFYNRYARSLASKTSSYAWQASTIFSRNLYMLVQAGDDNAVRTFESGRYYAVTAAKLTNAAMHLHVVAPKRTLHQANKQELHRFAQYMGKDNKTLAKEITDKKRLGRESKKMLRSLKSERDALQQQISTLVYPGAVLSKEDGLLLKQLGQKQRKVAEQLSTAQRAHFALNRDLRKEVAFLKLRKQSADEVRIQKELHEKHGVFVTRRKLRQDIADTQAEARKKLVKKYGKEITAYSDKSVKREIKNLTKQAKELKAKIKALQAKGSALSQAQRLSLKNMMDQHASISKKLRSLIGLDKDRALLNAEIALKGKLLNRMYANANAFSNALFAMRRVVLRPMREGAEYGVQGFGAGMNVLANRQLHRMMKKVFKAGIRYVPSAAAFLATGDVHTARLAATYVDRATKMAVIKSKAVVKKTAKTAAKAAVEGTKKAVSAIAPQPVKHGVHYVSKLSKSLQGRFRTVTALKQKLSQKFWASRLGQSISSVTNAGRNMMQFAKAATRVLKSVMIKVIVGFVLLFLLCGVIASMAGAPAGGAAGGLILSPYEGTDGKIDLSPYVEILNECQEEYDKKIENTRLAYLNRYDKVNIIPAIPDNNVREILSMMAVRCSQDLDLSNSMIKRYLKSIFNDSHFYTTQESEFYSCSGCKTRVVNIGHSADCPDDCNTRHTTEEKYCPGTHQDLTITLHVLFFDEIFTADSMGNEGQTAVAGQEIGTFRITHYCACYTCCGKNPGDPGYGITATGTTATANRTIAVDPNVIPLGTHVVIDGVEYIAEDTGGAIDDNRIDIYVSSHEEALALGVINRPVYYASYEGESVVDTGEWDGWTEDNVFWCKTIYSMDWKELYTGIPNVTDVMGNETNLDGVTFVDGDRPGNQAIVDTAMAQLGQVGGQPYWSWYGFDSRVEWCATFVSWCANQTGALGTAVPKFASCRAQGVPWFQEHGQWASGGDIVPSAGDIIFFDWEGNGVPDHVGIVIGTDGDKVYTIEGNSGDAVRTKSYNLNSKLIFGYGLPNY